jgi:hypothetical protein
MYMNCEFIYNNNVCIWCSSYTKFTTVLKVFLVAHYTGTLFTKHKKIYIKIKLLLKCAGIIAVSHMKFNMAIPSVLHPDDIKVKCYIYEYITEYITSEKLFSNYDH